MQYLRPGGLLRQNGFVLSVPNPRSGRNPRPALLRPPNPHAQNGFVFMASKTLRRGPDARGPAARYAHRYKNGFVFSRQNPPRRRRTDPTMPAGLTSKMALFFQYRIRARSQPTHWSPRPPNPQTQMALFFHHRQPAPASVTSHPVPPAAAPNGFVFSRPNPPRRRPTHRPHPPAQPAAAKNGFVFPHQTCTRNHRSSQAQTRRPPTPALARPKWLCFFLPGIHPAAPRTFRPLIRITLKNHGR